MALAPAVHGPGVTADVFVVALAVLYWVPYHRRAGRLAREGHAVPRWRQWCYAAGLLVLVAALSTPLGVLSEKLLVAHMVEHLLIGDIGALLIVLGLTGPMLAPLLRIGLFARLRVFTHPLVALPVWADRPLRLAHPRALPGRAPQRGGPRARARLLPAGRHRDVDGADRPAAEARLVRQPRAASATSSPCA